MKRSALVTGGSRGIGRAVVQELAQAGWPVCVNYLEQKDAAELVVRKLQDQGLEAIAFQADVADREAVERMARAAGEALGPVELVANNAGPCSRISPTRCGIAI